MKRLPWERECGHEQHNFGDDIGECFEWTSEPWLGDQPASGNFISVPFHENPDSPMGSRPAGALYRSYRNIPNCPKRVTDPEAASAVMKVIEAAVLSKGRVEERLRYIGVDPTQPNAYGDMQPLADAVAALARQRERAPGPPCESDGAGG